VLNREVRRLRDAVDVFTGRHDYPPGYGGSG
jgi:hypothetical protein